MPSARGMPRTARASIGSSGGLTARFMPISCLLNSEHTGQRSGTPVGSSHNGRMNLREVQAPIKRRYEEEPEAAQITMTVRSAPSDLSDPLHCAIAPDAVPGLTWRSGAHPGVGGAG